AKSRRVFVLLTDMPLEDVAGDVERGFGKIILCERFGAVRGYCFHDVNADAGGRTQTCAGRNLRSQKQIYRNITSHMLEDRNRNFQFTLHAHGCDIAEVAEDSKVRGYDLDPV